MIRGNDLDINEFLLKIDKNNRLERLSIFICGVLMYAISFTLFFNNYDIVIGGSAGLANIVNELTGMSISLFIFFISLLLLVLGYITLGKEMMVKTIFGVIVFPVFMEFSLIFPKMIDLSNTSMFLIVFFGGIFMGVGNGIIIRSGYSVGGFQTIYQILYKYYGISIGKSTLVLNGILVAMGGYMFGLTRVLYAIIGLYVASVVTDRVMLETSITKTFFVVTDKSKEINQYIIENLGRSATIMKGRGGYSNDNKRILMCAMPTREYYMAEEIMKKIDEDAFILILDTYEIYGGV
ncbi:MAG: YitT family protein [Bacilli bacterium]|nr:YitT family protein [Bacilli bacterium]